MLLQGQVLGTSLGQDVVEFWLRWKGGLRRWQRNAQWAKVKRKDGWPVSGIEGLRELSLVWKTEWEAQRATNVMAVGCGTTNDVEFRVYRESNGVRRGLKDWENKEWLRDERGCKKNSWVWQEWRMESWRGQRMVSESALSSNHLRASLSPTLCLDSMKTTGSTRNHSFKMLYFPNATSTFASMVSVSVLGTNISYLGKWFSQISVMYVEFHSSSCQPCT